MANKKDETAADVLGPVAMGLILILVAVILIIMAIIIAAYVIGTIAAIIGVGCAVFNYGKSFVDNTIKPNIKVKAKTEGS